MNGVIETNLYDIRGSHLKERHVEPVAIGMILRQPPPKNQRFPLTSVS